MHTGVTIAENEKKVSYDVISLLTSIHKQLAEDTVAEIFEKNETKTHERLINDDII